MKYLLLLLFTLSFAFSKAEGLQFTDCNSQDCNDKKLQDFEEQTFKLIQSKLGYIVSDSLYLSFRINNIGVVTFSHEFVTSSSITLTLAKEQIRALSAKLKPSINGKTYSWSWKISLPKNVNEYTAFENTIYFPLVSQCNTFNQKGKKACFRYVLNVADWEISKRYPKDNARYNLYFQNGKVVGVDPTRLPLNKSYTDSAVSAINRKVLQMADSTTLQNSENFVIEIEMGNTFNRSYAKKRLKYLRTLSSKRMYIDETFEFSAKYYNSKPKKEASNVLKNLAHIGMDKLDTIQVKGKSYSIDSIRGVSETGIVLEKQRDNSFPIYAGCENSTNSKEETRKCFQQKILTHVSSNFQFPDEARTQGIQGRIYVNFVIEKDGSIGNIDLIRNVHPLLDFESIRVVSEIPDVDKPAMQKGEPVRMSFTLPINTKLQ
ncbi:Gram-negative bacterial tonB protein [Owenweeksia hongkongensis DSM 17368]|uniref:Gram-negative bacterial tonB protein n=1 Tax=Owenweeksia hongkongensis (strain DSM 17368 / CIP 108786 / JCM 12287 / NRRL B-23963 / UST20020801) TaxID=926562 RepID=G8R1X0_OWEHD|nr:energy transducer TonB [Owenweeksia hongkongensis]AEV33920.1 Gram-negative bacterial tonB protein [Owenweeksia hongkongensis DSM 17368]